MCLKYMALLLDNVAIVFIVFSVALNPDGAKHSSPVDSLLALFVFMCVLCILHRVMNLLEIFKKIEIFIILRSKSTKCPCYILKKDGKPGQGK